MWNNDGYRCDGSLKGSDRVVPRSIIRIEMVEIEIDEIECSMGKAQGNKKNCAAKSPTRSKCSYQTMLREKAKENRKSCPNGSHVKSPDRSPYTMRPEDEKKWRSGNINIGSDREKRVNRLISRAG